MTKPSAPIVLVLAVAAVFSLACAARGEATGSRDAPAGRAAAPGGARAGRGAGAAGSVPVSVIVVERRDVPVYLSGLGTVTAYNTVTVKTRVDGQIVQVAFREGQDVRKGDPLAVIDPRPYEVMRSQAEAARARDEAALRDAKLNTERFADLFRQGIVPQQQLDSQRAQADQLQAAVQLDQAQIDNARLQLSYCRITSPVDGRVGLKLVDEGNIVRAADQTGLLVITQLEPIAVVFTLPEDDLPAVAKQSRATALKAIAYSRDDKTELAAGTLLTIDNQIDVATGTARLKAVFDNKDRSLWPNQFVNVRLLLETRKDQLVIPAAALQRGPDGTYVYVVKADQTVEVRPLKVALTQGGFASVADGLAQGDQVVTDGQEKLQAGSKVEPRVGGRKQAAAADP